MRRFLAYVRHLAARLGVALLCVACRGPGTRGGGERTAPHVSAGTSSNTAAPGPGDAALARFDGLALTVRDFEERLASQPPQIRAEYATPVAREKLLDEMVRLELLAQEAKRRGLDRSPRIRVRISEILVEEMMNGLFGSEELEAARVTDEEVRRYYDAHSAEFSSPEERRALDIVLGDRAEAEAALRQASGHPADEAFFRRLASEKSQDPDVRARAGDLGFFSATSANRPPDTVRDAVFQLRHTGDVVPNVVPSEGKFHVLMLTGVRPRMVRSQADTQALVRARLAQEKRREAAARFTDDLVSRARVEVHRELLPRIRE